MNRPLSRAEVQEAIRELLADGLIEPCGTRNGKTVYRATKAGRVHTDARMTEQYMAPRDAAT